MSLSSTYPPSRFTFHASRFTSYSLPAIILLGLAVRLWGLMGYGVWFDEAYHVQLVRLPTVGDMLNAVLSNPPSDPLYVLLLRGWVTLFGQSDGAIRLLSVIFSTATLPATYWLGRTLFDKRAGLLAALFLAVSPYAVELGQEAALYALTSLTTTLALAAGWRWRSTGSRRDGLLFVGLGIVAIYSHYVVAVILGLFALLSMTRWAGPRKVSARAWFLAHAAIFVAWLPWLIPLLLYWLSASVPRATLQHTFEWSEIGGALTQFSSGTAALQRGVRPLEWAGLLAGGVLLGLGWWAGEPPQRRGVRVLLIIFATIFLIPALVAAATGLWLFVPHFMLFLLPALFVVLASGLLLLWKRDKNPAPEPQLPQKTRNRAISNTCVLRFTFPLLLAVWIVVQAFGLVFYYRYPPHGADGLQELAATINKEIQPGDTVLVTPPILTPTLRQYYEGPLHGLPYDFDLRGVYAPYAQGTNHANLTPSFNAASSNHPRIWLVYNGIGWDEGGKLLKDAEARFKEIKHQSYAFGELYLFER